MMTASRLMQLVPESPSAQDLRGRVALGRHRFVEAEAYFRHALELDPARWQSMSNLGLALKGQNRQPEAMVAFEAAWRANPKAILTRRNLFSATQAYIGAGGVLAWVLWFHLWPWLAHLANLPSTVEALVFVGGLILTIAGFWWFGLRRRRKLSPDVDRFYRVEVVRERNLELMRGLFKAGPGTIIVLGLVALILADPPWVWIGILVGVVAVIGWNLAALRVWRRYILPRLRPEET